ncbi:MAG: transposase [Anaerolineales bacterium]|nr:transposase [Anaerolineales bacterium]
MKKLPETDALFERLAQVNPNADADATVLRMSVDAKATIPIGLFSRGGYSRCTVKAWDHDFRPTEKVTPLGVFLPATDELFLFFITGPRTADAIADCIRDTWLQVTPRFPLVRTLVLNLDNGPENHSRRTQFMQRLTECADEWQLTLELAYYPPYHSKYNPIERVWGVLEQHWNGVLLDSLTTIMQFAQSMTYNHVHPVVKQVAKTYATGVKLTHKAMEALEQRFERLAGLEKYCVRIAPLPA